MPPGLIDGIKPKECVGCGFCCIKAICAEGKRLYPSAKECPLLKWNIEKNRYFCSLALIRGQIGKNYRKALFIGDGCCASLNDWRNNVKERTNNKTSHLNSLSTEFQLFIKSIAMEPFISSDTIACIFNNYSRLLSNSESIHEDDKTEIFNMVKHTFVATKNDKFKSFI